MLEELLSQNESKILEFKENLESLSGIIKTVIAFANTAGGTIVIGIEDKTKKIIGVKDALFQEERIASVLTDSIAPLLIPNIEIQTYRKKELILIHVPQIAAPFYLKSAGLDKGTYVRFGSTNRVADTQTIQSLQLLTRNVSFDELPYPQGSIENLDVPVIETLFKKINKSMNLNKLKHLGVVTQSKNAMPTLGGILLFGKNRASMFPEAIIRCARFFGTDKTEFIDQLDITDYFTFAIDIAISFIRRNTQLRAKIESIKREEIPEYPLVALREALINAIVHADYSMKDIFISIAIFNDRIEFTNPGGLPFGLTLQHALTGSSKIRNRVIAKVFRELTLVEQWGSGLKRIINACKQHGLKEPKFEELNNHFRVTLYNNIISEKKLVNWQKQLVDYLQDKNKISPKEAAKLWNVSSRTTRERLKSLTNLGFISKIGTSPKDPYGFYVLI